MHATDTANRQSATSQVRRVGPESQSTHPASPHGGRPCPEQSSVGQPGFWNPNLAPELASASFDTIASYGPMDVSVHPTASASIWIDPPQEPGKSPVPPAEREPIGPAMVNPPTPVAPLLSRDAPPATTPSAGDRATAITTKPTAERPVAETPAVKPADAATSSVEWTPSWEVDSFDFPELARRVIDDPALLRGAGYPLDLALSENAQTVLVTADRPRIGRTSVAICLAVAGARAGLRVALVDAAPGNASKSPTLTETLKLDIHRGWPDAIRHGNSVAETAIRSIEDQLTLLPWSGSATEPVLTVAEFAELITTLRSAFDLVVVDGPTVSTTAWDTVTARTPIRRTTKPQESYRTEPRPSAETTGPRTILDAAVVVRDARDTSRLRDIELLESIRRKGLIALGLIENFG